MDSRSPFPNSSVLTDAGPRSANPYSPKTIELIRRHPDALILDFGAGNPAPDEIFSNVVRLDFVHYRSADVVASTANLPFRSDSFDHVVSEAVFEHVRDPVHYARELFRVLKPGGQIIVDSAFLQPLHGDPYHFFNMTLHGLEEVMKPFRKVRSGVEPYQSAGMTVNILRQQFLDLIVDPPAKAELEKRIGGLDYCAYDRFLSPKGQRDCGRRLLRRDQRLTPGGLVEAFVDPVTKVLEFLYSMTSAPCRASCVPGNPGSADPRPPTVKIPRQRHGRRLPPTMAQARPRTAALEQYLLHPVGSGR